MYPIESPCWLFKLHVHNSLVRLTRHRLPKKTWTHEVSDISHIGLVSKSIVVPLQLPSSKRLHNYGKLTFFMDKSIISMAMLNSYVCLPEGMSTSR